MRSHTNTPFSAAYATSESVRFLLWFYPPQAAVTLMGCCGLSGYITNQHRLQEPLLSCTSLLGASTKQLYFKALSVNQPERFPKKVLNPRRLCTLLLHVQGNSKLKPKTRRSVGCLSIRVYHRVQNGRDGLPQTGLPLQSFKNSYGYLYLSPGG